MCKFTARKGSGGKGGLQKVGGLGKCKGPKNGVWEPQGDWLDSSGGWV